MFELLYWSNYKTSLFCNKRSKVETIDLHSTWEVIIFTRFGKNYAIFNFWPRDSFKSRTFDSTWVCGIFQAHFSYEGSLNDQIGFFYSWIHLWSIRNEVTETPQKFLHPRCTIFKFKIVIFQEDVSLVYRNHCYSVSLPSQG